MSLAPAPAPRSACTVCCVLLAMFVHLGDRNRLKVVQGGLQRQLKNNCGGGDGAERSGGESRGRNGGKSVVGGS